MSAYHHVNAEAASKKLWEVWNAVWPFMESTDASVRKSVAQSLDLLAQCFTPSLASAAISAASTVPCEVTSGS